MYSELREFADRSNLVRCPRCFSSNCGRSVYTYSVLETRGRLNQSRFFSTCIVTILIYFLSQALGIRRQYLITIITTLCCLIPFFILTNINSDWSRTTLSIGKTTTQDNVVDCVFYIRLTSDRRCFVFFFLFRLSGYFSYLMTVLWQITSILRPGLYLLQEQIPYFRLVTSDLLFSLCRSLTVLLLSLQDVQDGDRYRHWKPTTISTSKNFSTPISVKFSL